ncbi:MAG: SAM-dependent methyltransferase, partial [Nitrospirota bacterium]
MAFDDKNRNLLQKMVDSCRRLLSAEFIKQLQELYGIQPGTGSVIDLSEMTHLTDDQYSIASLLRDRIDHLAGSLHTPPQSPPYQGGAVGGAIDRVIREQAFTILNRFAALRMSEEREIVRECVRNGMQSQGFQVYLQIAGSSLGDTYQRYRVFLGCLFDELAIDLGTLFDRYSPFGLLFPREQALNELLVVINDPQLKDLWKEDETIGWVYQYFNTKEEREAMRKASQAPRNSRELAVRNQFFTPRYVVEFLTDNTLGRIWYEMTKGNTSLKDNCRYLVRRPNEIFLSDGEDAPNDPTLEKGGEGGFPEKSQEELLKEPVYIPHRPIKDPRMIMMLDPACGSMHFGLYSFDLFETIYDEAWDIYPDLLSDIREQVSSKEDFMKLVPEMIIRHNIHGIDIDPRAAQIAELSLWLRAQKSYQRLKIKAPDRPRITKSNIVCAEPMPGEKEMLEEFISKLKPAVLGELVREVWNKMQLAGEAGSLLKIEEELKTAIEKAKKEWE